MRLAALFVCLFWAQFALAQEAADAVAPEAAGAGALVLSGPAADAQVAKAQGRAVEAQDWMVVAANPLAVEAGARVLRDGGTAADAMIAVQAVLGLVEPQSSGLGGVAAKGAVSRPSSVVISPVCPSYQT
ncbi:MAG: gamma-glutamyltransferase, partial [Pseudomonadota bacterium]